MKALNQLFKKERLNDELSFLQKKVIALQVNDLELTLYVTLINQKIMVPRQKVRPDVTMQGTVYDFLLLASRREDPDTLFFNRRLKLSGDTELGLYVKNFLDALDLTRQWKYLQSLADKTSRLVETLGSIRQHP
ncbi:MAG: SCP2 sterol-binding domain-containing protein [Gammaproteobacteria bacterium]|nr:SCP2 sterol-binding domain-containing protein [Gammaproteobacteria bacterium]